MRDLARCLAPSAYRTVSWREGSAGLRRARLAARSVRCAHRDYGRATPYGEQWLLIEWPTGSAEPTKYWLANLPAVTALKQLVRLAQLRWRIEHDCRELKQALGLNHFEGRSWRGFHQHATRCIAAYGFLVAARCAFSLVAAAAKASARRIISGRAAPRLRPQRHEPSSIASLRIILARLLLHSLPHCPYCHRLSANPDAPFL